MKLQLVLTCALLLPASVISEEAATQSCVQALEQVATLHAVASVYRFTGSHQRQYLEDADRPAEIARLQKMIAASCSTDPKLRAEQESEAQRLNVARSPECAIERDRLSAMEKPDSRDAADAIAEKRKLVTRYCPAIELGTGWLVQWTARSALTPDGQLDRN